MVKIFPGNYRHSIDYRGFTIALNRWKKGYPYVSEKYSHNLFTRANQHETDFASLYFRNNHMLYSALFGNMSD